MSILAFSHIPKTAGTSLNVLLRRYFGCTLLAVIPRNRPGGLVYQREDLDNDSKLYRNMRCVSGHPLKPYIDFGEWERRLQWFTFLRAPRARYISLYIHQQTNGMNQYKMDIREWSSRLPRQNGMVQMIAGEQNLQMAIDVLETKMQFIGVAEHYEESLDLFVNKFELYGFDKNLGEAKMKSRDNRLAEEIHAHPEIYDACIDENNKLDNELYAYVMDNIWLRQSEQINELHEISGDIRKQSALNHRINMLGFRLKNEFVYRGLVRHKIL